MNNIFTLCIFARHVIIHNNLDAEKIPFTFTFKKFFCSPVTTQTLKPEIVIIITCCTQIIIQTICKTSLTRCSKLFVVIAVFTGRR